MKEGDDMTDQEMAKQIEFLADENRQLRKSGCKLAEAALYVAREYDGVHRLMSAVSDWTMTIANEGGRGKRSVTVGDDVDAETVKCCKTCRFWHLKENKICGQCRRFPPARDHQEILYGWSFPVTHPAEWCGEWREIIDHG